MDGERKKRKKDIDHASASASAAAAAAEEEEGNEDEKIEKFFALIRSTRDVKERLLTASNADTSKALHKGEGGVDGKKQQPPPPPVAVWNPAFLPGDFMEDGHHRPESPVRRSESSSVPPDLNIPNTTHDESAAAGPSSTKTEEDRDENGVDDDDDGHDLDLNLSL